MRRHRVTAVLLIAGIGTALHLGHQSLAARLPQFFPRVRNSLPARENPFRPDLVRDEAPEPMAWERKVILKRAGEWPDEILRPSVTTHLVRSQPIPLLPPIDMEPLDDPFPKPSPLRPAIDFWKKVYAIYTTRQAVIHDSLYLDVIYEVADSDSAQTRADGIRRALDELSGWQSGPLSPEAQRVALLFQAIPGGNEKFLEARDRVRWQVGLKDRFLEGLQASGRYLPIFEEVFASYGLPRLLTRLVFVESLFHERAFSKTGAAGLWQFMPGTGRNYLTVSKLVDERYDPILATHAAARLLKLNHDLLGSWPLAINAYNTGANRLQDAVNRLGTRDISAIISRYDHPAYGFASRNFYPEFLAALEITQEEEKHFGAVAKEEMLAFDLVEIPVTLTFPEISQMAQTPMAQLEELHPAFAPEVFGGDYALPAGSEIRLPRGRYLTFASRFIQNTLGGEDSSEELAVERPPTHETSP